MNTPLSAHIDMDHLGDLRNAEVRRGEQLLAIVVTSEDLDPVARDLSDETFCRAFNDEQMALCRKFAAVEDLLEACDCQDDLEKFTAFNFGAKVDIVIKWLPRIDELFPNDHGHFPHANWTHYQFGLLPAKLRDMARAKAEGAGR